MTVKELNAFGSLEVWPWCTVRLTKFGDDMARARPKIIFRYKVKQIE